MSVFGIICETNPIHNGHKHLIDSAREMGAEYIVCVMSGNTAQRGEFAIIDKYTRSEALLRCGADLVLELPFPWCSGSAEYFSMASVSILKNICDTVIFGSECGDIDALTNAANAAQGEGFKKEYEENLLDGKPAAGSYFDLLKKYTGNSFSSNDLLGIEYIKSSKLLGTGITFQTVRRVGDGYLSQTPENACYPSAMSIRRLWMSNDMKDINMYMPHEAMDVYTKAIEQGNITDTHALDILWLSFFRTHNGQDFENIAGAGGGIGNRICEMSHKACSYEELTGLIANKRYTDSSLKRTMLYCMAGVTKSDLDECPKETLLLAADTKGRELLAKCRKDSVIRIVTKPADLNKELRQNILMKRIDSIYALTRIKKYPSDEYIRKNPYIKQYESIDSYFFICFFIASKDVSLITCSILHASFAAVSSSTPILTRNAVSRVCLSYIASAMRRPSSVSLILPSASTMIYPPFFSMPMARLTEGFVYPKYSPTSIACTVFFCLESI